MLPIPEYWRRDVYPRLPELVKKYGSFHLYNKPGIIKIGNAMKAAFAKIPYRQYFAVKACPEPYIVDFLINELHFGNDCSSIGEAAMVRALGARGEDVIYNSNDTSEEEFRFAMQDKDCMLGVDDISFVPLIPVFPRKIFFRLNSGKRLITPEGNVIGDPYNAKYGITEEQIIPAYKMALRRGAKEFGIHIMVCSNDRHATHFVETARFTLEKAALLYRKLGIKVKWIDIGGGFGTPYRPADPWLNINWIGEKISKLFIDFAAQYGWMPKLMTECGRFVTAPHGILVNPVLHVMQKYRHFIGVPAAMTGCPRPAFYKSYHHIDVLNHNGNLRRGPRHFTNVVGPKCEDWDRLTAVGEERLLPWSIKRGDILVTGNTGAHCHMDGNYNFRLLLAGVLDQDGTNKNTILIRKPQKNWDLFRQTIFPKGKRELLKKLLENS